MSGLMKFETPFSDHDYAEDFSQHDISNEVTIGNGFEDWEDQNSGRRTPRRNLKKPQTFVPEQPKKAVATKRKKSTEKNGPKRGGSKKAKKEEPIKYEVDYIFGKRPDKERKGKWEYRVLWKNFPRTEATWEPEENLRFCDEAVKAYEQGQLEEGIVGNDDEDDVEVDVVGNGKAATKNANVTMRKKEESKKLVRSRSTKPPKAPEKKEKVLGTMRARTVSVSPVKKQVARRTGHKPKNQANKEKEVSPALSHSTSGGSSDPPPLVVDVKKANSSVKKKENNKGGKAQQPTSTSHLANLNSRAKSESVSSKEGSSGGTGGSSNVQDIAMVESVKRSNIEGVGLVAKVIFKDGLSKKMTVKSVKEKVPLVLIEYYEKELGLID